MNDRSAPLLDSKSQTPKSETPSTDHPYIRLYQYLHQQQQRQPQQQGALPEEQKKASSDKSSALGLESKIHLPPSPIALSRRAHLLHN